ncbi:Os05g0380250 [Oryza sativa Japonica Group]|jgi:hypothetical protein|uniref:Os05g0380250 protein n=1 Tax=Oryza sativa subsp. japonica TaxID=39947 RepID=A0A0P0WLW6_ORYSJ|nr:hypothetical protein EE612_029147 [Oryza sativa]BAS93757.1 Os05g0380250 [Oryza sativa Japonica Group]
MDVAHRKEFRISGSPDIVSPDWHQRSKGMDDRACEQRVTGDDRGCFMIDQRCHLGINDTAQLDYGGSPPSSQTICSQVDGSTPRKCRDGRWHQVQKQDRRIKNQNVCKSFLGMNALLLWRL